MFESDSRRAAVDPQAKQSLLLWYLAGWLVGSWMLEKYKLEGNVQSRLG